MKISTKGRYGLKTMFELAKHYENGPVSIRKIAQTHEISDAYLEQLIQKLKNDGIVTSVRGAQGGYRLTRPPHDITVGQILRALEGSIAPFFCAEDPKTCAYTGECVECYVYRTIYEAIERVTDEMTLQTMLDKNMGATTE